MNQQQIKINLEFEPDPDDPSVSIEEIRRECQSLRDYINSNVATASLVQDGQIGPGNKGVEMAFGQILVEAIAAPVAGALVNCVKAWLESRKKEITLRFEKDGKTVEFQSSNFSEKQIQEVISELGAFLAD